MVAQFQHVEELLAAEVSRKRLQRFETMHENHSITMLQKVFGGWGAPWACTEVVHETDRIVLQWNRSASRLKENKNVIYNNYRYIFTHPKPPRILACAYRDQYNIVLDFFVTSAELL